MIFVPMASSASAAGAVAKAARTAVSKVRHGKRGHKAHSHTHRAGHNKRPVPATAAAFALQPAPCTIDIAIASALPELLPAGQADAGAYTQPVTTAPQPEELATFRQAMVTYASSLLGTRYRSGGKQPGGFDCSGFTGYVYSQFGIRLPACSGAQATLGQAVCADSARPGDLVFFARPAKARRGKAAGRGRIYHAALVADTAGGRVRIIHSASRIGVTLTDISADGYWKRNLHSIRRVIDRPAALAPAI